MRYLIMIGLTLCAWGGFSVRTRGKLRKPTSREDGYTYGARSSRVPGAGRPLSFRAGKEEG